MTFDPENISTPKIKRAYDYWRSKRRGDALPKRSDVDPAEIVPLLPNTLLVDVKHEPLDFVFRLVGTEVVRRYGREFTGKRLVDLDLDGMNHEIFNEYALTIESRAPEYFVDQYVMHNGRTMHFERILMPLCDDGKTINMLFGVQVAVNASQFDTGIPRL